jgi:hypothetical protein
VKHPLKLVFFFVLLASLTCAAVATAELQYEKGVDWNLPDAVRLRLEKSGTLLHYELSHAVNPFYLRGDLDGDGKPDYAILAVNKVTKKRGIAVIRSSGTGVDMLGAGGTKLRVGSGAGSYLLEDFDWMDEWHIERKQTVADELGREVAASMVGEGLAVAKSESASALVFWNGTNWLWRQMGD